MRVPDEWVMRAAVVPVPWAHPDRSQRYDTLLDAVINANSNDEVLSPWIILEDGRMLTPKQIAELRDVIDYGGIAVAPNI